VLVLPGLLNATIAADLPIPTPIHLAVLTTVAAAAVAFTRFDWLLPPTREAVAITLIATIVLLVLSPAIAGIIDGRLFGIGLVLAYAYRYLVRSRDLNEAAVSDPSKVALSLGGAAALALVAWGVVAFSERFPEGNRAADFWSDIAPLMLTSIATPLLVVSAARAAARRTT
jgi:hypothetical protein